MRSILIIIVLIVYIICMLPALLVFYLIGRKDPDKAERAVHACLSWLFGVFRFLAGTRLTVIGLENVPKDRPVLYIGNHNSYFDIIYTYPLCVLPTSYVAKDDILKIPLFSVWGKLMKCLFFNRSNIKQSLKMILDAVNYLKEGTSVFIFPEGTRNKTGKLVPLNEFHNGSFKPAEKSGAPVVPVAISGTADVWEAHMPWVRKADVCIQYGTPIYLSDLSPEEKKTIGAYMQSVIEEMLTNRPDRS